MCGAFIPAEGSLTPRGLPPMPWIVVQMAKLLSTPVGTLSMSHLSELIRADEVISAELLRRANSAVYAHRSAVSTVEQAASLIGIREIQKLVLTISLGGFMKRMAQAASFRRCWRHSLACALLAEEIAHAFDFRPHEAYTAGLLHDVGRLALLVKYPLAYGKLLAGWAVPAHGDLMDAERAVLGTDHCETGAALAREWAFPNELVEVILNHHCGGRRAVLDLTQLINISCRLADSLRFGVSPSWPGQVPSQLIEELPPSGRDVIREALVEIHNNIARKISTLE